MPLSEEVLLGERAVVWRVWRVLSRVWLYTPQVSWEGWMGGGREGGGQVLGEGVAGWAGAGGVVVGDLDEDLVEVLDDVFDVLCLEWGVS